MEFQYDPAVGHAVEITRGGQQELQPDEGPTPAELTRHRLSESAQGLANRQHNSQALGDEDGPLELSLAIDLQKLQQQLYRGGLNPLEEQQLIRQAEAIAGQLAVGGGPFNNQDIETEPEDFNQAYRNSNPGVDQDLAFAAEIMGEELAGEFNSLISSDDELTKVAALDTLHNLRESPESFIAKEQSTGIDEFTRSSIAEQVGEELANDIQTLGNAVAGGVISPAQAIATAAKDPSLQQALFSLAQQGIIKIAL